MEIKEAILENEKDLIKNFLSNFDLEYDNDIDYSLYAVEADHIVGTISISQNIIKAFAISPKFQGENIANILISDIINYLYQKQIYHYLVYTKPENRVIFENLNFREIITTDKICLLESKNESIVDTLVKIKEEYHIEGEDIGCIVMNCNPFTLGHQYLIKEASKKHETLIVFILEEDRSFFKYEDRIKLVRAGVKDLQNVLVIPSSKYLVSALTFPTYFLKKDVDIVYEQALCDALIFKKYFIPIFNIKKRYLGTETDLVTNKYNHVLKDVLKDQVEIIERIKFGDENISASLVRAYLKNKDFEKIEKLVPKTTLDFLKEHYG